MSGEELQKAELVRRFSHHKDNPYQYWLTGLIESIELKGDETVFKLPFLSIVSGSNNKPYDKSQFLRQQRHSSTFNVRVWNIFKTGIIHRSGLVDKKWSNSIFPTRSLHIPNPYTEDFRSFKDLDCYSSFIRLMTCDKRSSHNIRFCVFNNVKTLDNKHYDQVLIPCSEIARFYYFNSSNLIELILTPGSFVVGQKNKIYNPASSGKWYDEKDQQITTILLRDGLSEDDGPIVARMAFSPTAKKSVSTIQQSLLNSDPQKFIQCSFPFDKATELECGTFEFNHSDKNILLITEIKKCTAPFPFDKLLIGIEQADKNENKEPGSSGGNNNDSPKPKNPSDPKQEEILPDQLGNSNTRDVSIYSFADRFMDLKNKDIKLIPSKYNASRKPGGDKKPIIKTINNKPGNSKPKKYSLKGNKKTNPGVTRIRSVTQERVFPKNAIEGSSETKEKDSQLKINRFKLIYDLKQEFEERGYSTSFTKFFDVGENSDFTYLTLDAESSSTNWPFMDYEKGIRRRALCLEVVCDIGTFSIIDYEVKGKNEASLKYFGRKDLTYMGLDDRIEICTTLIQRYGKLAVIKEGVSISVLPDNLIAGRCYHKNSSAEMYANEIIASIKKLANK